MNDTISTGSPALHPSQETLTAATTAEQCLDLAAQAEAAGDTALRTACLERAVRLDRNCQAALLNLAAATLDQKDWVSTFGFLEEAARVTPLPAEVELLRKDLYQAVNATPELGSYLHMVGRGSTETAAGRLSILVLTRSFSSAGDDRNLPEFVCGLLARGHEVRVLTSAGESAADDASLEQHLLRSLTPAGDRSARDNAARLRTALNKSRVNLVIAAELDGADVSLLRQALEQRVPVLHWLANPRLPFAVDDQPCDAHYWIAPVSGWTGTALRNGGYETARMDLLQPGVSIARWFRLYLPDTRRLRLACAGSLRPGGGADTCLHALGRLREAGIDFTAEFVGEAPDESYLRGLREKARALGLEDSVCFNIAPLTGAGVSALLARSNVLVVPAEFPQPFGILSVRALAAGVVVVSSATGGTRELIRDGTDGLLFAAGKDEALAGALDRLIREPELMARLQRSGQARALAFSVEKTVVQIETLAEQMCAAIATTETEFSETPVAVDGSGV
jgi:glycosyltransferase involved in cell wall biosynthesis